MKLGALQLPGLLAGSGVGWLVGSMNCGGAAAVVVGWMDVPCSRNERWGKENIVFFSLSGMYKDSERTITKGGGCECNLNATVRAVKAS